ncbi:MAG: hypothetical protein M1826_005848 [Phylliscum demangeonii]|nr:MAG: hypothetical protein M1826_005848 [Phylliscum demangeonii]
MAVRSGAPRANTQKGFNPNLNWVLHPAGLQRSLARLGAQGAAAASRFGRSAPSAGKPEEIMALP